MPIARAGLTGQSAPLAESVLCPLTGVAAWLVWRRVEIRLDSKRAALRRWGWLLMLSALWPLAVDGGALRGSGPAVGTLLLLLCLGTGLWTAAAFRPLHRAAAGLVLPYAAWLGASAAAALLAIRF